jgi:hypothetical protein
LTKFVIDRKIRNANVADGLGKVSLTRLLIDADRKGIEAVQRTKSKKTFFDLFAGESGPRDALNYASNHVAFTALRIV